MKKILGIMLMFIMVMSMAVGCGKSENEKIQEKMEKKYKDDKVITLVNDKTTAKVYLSDKKLAQNDSAVTGVKTDRNIISGKNFSVLNKNEISQVGITLEDNTIVQYQMIDGTYTEKNLSTLGNVHKLKIDDKEYVYIVIKDEDRYTSYVSIPGDKNHSILMIVESFEEINDKILTEYTNRVFFVKNEKK